MTVRNSPMTVIFSAILAWRADGDFLGYLGLEGCGIFTNHDNDVFGKIRKMADSL